MKNYRYELNSGRHFDKFIGCNADNKKEACRVIRDILSAKYAVKVSCSYIAGKLTRY